MSIKINRLELENVKRVKAVIMEPTQNGLTIVGGRNNQGKTSVLDAIAWGLGGDKYRPSEPRRDGSVVPPSLHIELSNGLIVERKGKNSDLKVIDPSGNRAGQQLVNEFVEQLALNLPKFIQATSKEKAKILLKIIGVGDELFRIEQEEQGHFNRRTAIGQIADQKRKYAAEMTVYPEAPSEPVSASELIRQQQSILTINGENQRKRENVSQYEQKELLLRNQISDMQSKVDALVSEQIDILKNLEVAKLSAIDLHDESTEALERNINDVEELNHKVRANMDKEKAESDAVDYKQQYDDLTGVIDSLRKEKTDLLEGAKLPLQGLSVADGELTYKGYKWDNLSGSDQLKVSTAIVRKLNPNCGFVLLDKLEQMDMDTLKDFGIWLEQEGLQAIATRVSTGEECSVIIEDGYNTAQIPEATARPQAPVQQQPTLWKAGEF